MSEVFTRDGHLLDLAIDRHLSQDLEPEAKAQLELHLEECPPCNQRHEAVRRLYDQPLPALKIAAEEQAPAEVLPFRPRSRWPVVAVAVLAMAAIALLVLRLPTDPDPIPDGPEVFTAKGGTLALEVHRQAEEGSTEQLVPGATVKPGDRLGFRVSSADAGFLLVAGVDSTGSVYPVFPQGTAPDAVRIEANTSPAPLDTAIALDATPGDERLVAIRCPSAFSLEDVRSALSRTKGEDLPPLREGCAQDLVRLVKESP